MTPVSNRQQRRSGSPRRPSPSSNTTAELVSDLAGVLRSPLASVRDSIESLRTANAGSVTGEQLTMLDAAMRQCHDLDRMIGKMLQIEQEQSNLPPVHRRRVAVTEIRQAVDQQLMAVGIPASIDVLWDGAGDPNLSVLVDSSLLSQMIVHLVTQSVAVTPEGGCVLIRLQTQPTSDCVRWSVIDQGPGICESEIHELLNQQRTDPAKFGLANCRLIAGLHFSTLDLYSRIGCGTEVSFNTVRSGPRNVAAIWSAWRIEQAASTSNATANGRSVARGSLQKLRIDSSPARISVSQSSAVPHCKDHLIAGTVTLGAAVSRASADAFDRFLQRHLQMFDLVYRIGTRRWAWAFDDDPQMVVQRIESLIDRASRVISGVRTNWSEPMMIPIDGRVTNLRLSDLLIRETLSESTSSGVVDKDTVRMGTGPIEFSQSATDRLDEELQRLSSQLKMQTKRLKRQAKQLRPLA